LIPDHYVIGTDRPGYHATPLYCMEMKANYTLMHENLLDTTHASFLHPGLLDDGELTGGEYRFEEQGGMLRLVREMECRPGPGVAALFKVREGYPYRRILSCETFPPNLNLARGHFIDPAHPGRPPQELTAAHAITPGGPDSLYLFHAIITSYPDEWPPEAVEMLRTVVAQDKDALEAIQERYSDLGMQVNEYSVKTDRAGLRFRQRIAEMVNEELAH
jgi:vanillate O-demethylase monooxygenase subunit